VARATFRRSNSTGDESAPTFAQMNLAVAAVLSVAILAAGRPSSPYAALNDTSRTSSRTPQLKRFNSRGSIKHIALDRKLVSIAHEDIAGFMNAMTMGFSAKDALQLNGIEVGDRVEFAFTVVDDGQPMLQKITKC
jgi:Cu(I)/Ag(I) efflux system periplasmic protein CusF